MASTCRALNPFSMIGPELLAEVMAEVIIEARANGLDMAAGFQGAWDLMGGIYSAWGRAGVDPDPRRKLTLADLVANFQYERQVEALVMAQALRAATRGLGTANEQHDAGVAQAIFDKCWPTIRNAWLWERDGLASEYLKLGSEVVHTPLIIYYTPTTPKPGEKIVCEAVSADQKLGGRLERMRQIIRLLYGPGSGIAVNYYWEPAGESVGDRDWQRSFVFAAPGKYPVKVRLEVAPFTKHTQTEPRVMLRREVPALVDIVVSGKKVETVPPPSGMAAKFREETYTTDSGTVLRTLYVVFTPPGGTSSAAASYRAKIRYLDASSGRVVEDEWPSLTASQVEQLGASNPRAGTVVFEVWERGGTGYAKATW